MFGFCIDIRFVRLWCWIKFNWIKLPFVLLNSEYQTCEIGLLCLILGIDYQVCEIAFLFCIELHTVLYCFALDCKFVRLLFCFALNCIQFCIALHWIVRLWDCREKTSAQFATMLLSPPLQRTSVSPSSECKYISKYINLSVSSSSFIKIVIYFNITTALTSNHHYHLFYHQASNEPFEFTIPISQYTLYNNVSVVQTVQTYRVVFRCAIISKIHIVTEWLSSRIRLPR